MASNVLSTLHPPGGTETTWAVYITVLGAGDAIPGLTTSKNILETSQRCCLKHLSDLHIHLQHPCLSACDSWKIQSALGIRLNFWCLLEDSYRQVNKRQINSPLHVFPSVSSTEPSGQIHKGPSDVRTQPWLHSDALLGQGVSSN